MKKIHFRFLSLVFLLFGIFFLLNSKTDITGAVIGLSSISSEFSSIFGIAFLLLSVVIFIGGKGLEKKLEEEYHWKKYEFDRPFMMTVDDKGNFVIGDRTTSESIRYGHKLPHPVLANEKRVYGAGEVLIKDGLIKEYNSGTGHYFDRRDPKGFDKQSKDVFEYFSKKSGWKRVRGGARYSKKHDVNTDLVNY